MVFVTKSRIMKKSNKDRVNVNLKLGGGEGYSSIHAIQIFFIIIFRIQFSVDLFMVLI